MRSGKRLKKFRNGVKKKRRNNLLERIKCNVLFQNQDIGNKIDIDVETLAGVWS